MRRASDHLTRWLPIPLPKYWLMINMSEWLSRTLSKTLRQYPASDRTSARLLDGAVAGRQMLTADPAAVPRARHALSGSILATQAAGDESTFAAWMTLIAADEHDLAAESLSAALVQ